MRRKDICGTEPSARNESTCVTRISLSDMSTIVPSRQFHPSDQ